MSDKKIIEINSLGEFLDEISKFEDKKIIYRGQSNKDWEVTSSAYRRLKNKTTKASADTLLTYNKELLKGAKRHAEEIKETHTDIRLLAKLQHYGAATSLIDFTESALIALWFACQEKRVEYKKVNGKVFCLDLSNLTKFLEVSLEDEKKDIDQILSLKFRENTDNIDLSNDNIRSQLAKDEKIAKWEPPITDNRILKQDSFFIFNKAGLLESDKFAKIIVIRKGGKKRILKELKQLNNLSEATIFPDFYGFAQNNATNKPYGPQDATAYFQQGNDKFALGKYKEAIEDYDEAIKRDPKFAEAYGNRGFANFALGNHKEAIKDYDKAIKINPQYAEAYNNRAFANFDLKQYKEAIKDYTEAIERNPKFAEAYYNRAFANFALKQYKEAITDYEEAKTLFEKAGNMAMAEECERSIANIKRIDE